MYAQRRRGQVQRGGAVHSWYGQRAGLAVDATGTAPAQSYAPDSAGVPGSAEAEDRLGAATVSGDLDVGTARA